VRTASDTNLVPHAWVALLPRRSPAEQCEASALRSSLTSARATPLRPILGGSNELPALPRKRHLARGIAHAMENIRRNRRALTHILRCLGLLTRCREQDTCSDTRTSTTMPDAPRDVRTRHRCESDLDSYRHHPKRGVLKQRCSRARQSATTHHVRARTHRGCRDRPAQRTVRMICRTTAKWQTLAAITRA
jgi:hypothetical protein